MRVITFLAIVFTMFFTFSPVAMAREQTDKPTLILAVHPYLAPDEVIKRFTPLADYLGQQLGQKVRVRVGPSYAAHIDAIGNDSVDIAFMGPVAYVELSARYSTKPLLARLAINGEPVFRGVIIVRKESTLNSLAELKGKRFAFGEKDSTMGTIIPRHMLQQAGVSLDDLAQHTFIIGHKNVALAVLSGSADAGAVKDEIFREMESQGLRVLATSPAISEHLFVTRANLPSAQVEQLRNALLALKNKAHGADILRSINVGATALVPVSNSDYANLRVIVNSLDTNAP